MSVTAEFTRKIKNAIGTNALSENELRAYQLKKIADVVQYVGENSRFYKEYLKSADCIKTWDDFFSLPFTSQEDIKTDPYAFLCVRPNDVERIVTFKTSGTSGIEKRVFFTAGDMEKTVDFFHRGMAFFTKPDDNVMILMPGETPGSVGDLLSKGLLRLGAKPIVYGIPTDFEAAAEFVAEKGINVAVTLPSQMYGISCARAAKKIRDRGALRAVLLSADFITPILVEKISKNLNCAVYEHYGMTETCFGGGVFCEKKDGYHLREDDMFFEIIHPQTGKKQKNGEYGEVAVTTFSHEAMPLVRYKTGDIARFKTERCACGYPIPVMERVQCRKSDLLFLNGDSFLSLPQIESAVMNITDYGDIRVGFCREGKKLSIGIYAPKIPINDVKNAFLKTEIFKKIEIADVAFSFSIIEKPKTDTRGMTKRKIIRT